MIWWKRLENMRKQTARLYINEMIRELLRNRVEKEEESFEDRILKGREILGIDTRIKFNRDELYDRKGLR